MIPSINSNSSLRINPVSQQTTKVEVQSLSGAALSIELPEPSRVSSLAIQILENHWESQGLKALCGRGLAQELLNIGRLSSFITLSEGHQKLSLADFVEDGGCYQYVLLKSEIVNDVSCIEYLVSKKNRGLLLQRFPSPFGRCKEYMMENVKIDGSQLCRAAPLLKADKELVMEAVKNDSSALVHASPALKEDPDVLSAALHRDNRSLEFTVRHLLI